VRFDRRPAAGSRATELLIEVSGVTLSGLYAEPSGRNPRALIVAIHGAGMHAGYFDAVNAPGLSLLDLASGSGYAVWAPDRPGIGASADLPPGRATLSEQADLLLEAIDRFPVFRAHGYGVFLVGHSYGLKVAWTIAARDTRSRFLGIDGSGAGVSDLYSAPRAAGQALDGAPQDSREMWGPSALYPERTFRRSMLPTHAMPAVQRAESARWVDDIRRMAHRIRVPMRITFAEHERFWPTDEYHLEELRNLFVNAPYLSIEIEPHGGHNISLGWAARSYHLKALAFLEWCSLSRRLG
jgi:pimeloyl-ACP methyl ester carboxylesterase